MRTTAASVVVALAVALLALCGAGTALAGTGGQAAAPGSAVNACENAMETLGASAASCAAGAAMISALPNGAGASNAPMTQPNCPCGSSTPTPAATPTCNCMASTPTPPPTPMCSCMSSSPAPPAMGYIPPIGDTRAASATADSKLIGIKAAKKPRSTPIAFAHTDSTILPITGANLLPLVAAASLCLFAGTAALVTVRVTGGAGRRRRPSRRAHSAHRAAR